jgi:sulfoxide reductase heme-binding subunit YedZ
MEPANRLLRRVPVALLYAGGAVPAVWLLIQAVTGGLGADPVKAMEHALGLQALQFLIAGLAVTPLRRLAGLNLLRFRRALGLLGFGYAGLHLAVWLLLDLQLRWAEIGTDLTRRPYVMVGMAAFLLLLPLAVTSTDRMVRRLGPHRWNRLHRLVYPAVLLAAGHFVMLGKTWQMESLAYLTAVGLLLLLRVVRSRHKRRQIAADPANI